MLISSSRHTVADLELWRDREASDLARARIHAGYRERAAKSLTELIRFIVDQPLCYCSVSWGKDSTVCAHLVQTVNPEIPLVWIRVEPIANPDCCLVRDAYLSLFPETRYEEITVWCDRGMNDWHATGTLERGFETANRRWGKRYVLGLRADESAGRRISLRNLGHTTRSSCRPIGFWSVADVFSYLAEHKLPVHPAYAMAGGGRWSRDHIRVSSLGGRRGDQFGRAEWEREYYGDVLNRLEATNVRPT